MRFHLRINKYGDTTFTEHTHVKCSDEKNTQKTFLTFPMMGLSSSVSKQMSVLCTQLLVQRWRKRT